MDFRPESEAQTTATQPKGRRTERIMLEIPIRVFSYGGSAGDFTEDTRTIMINRDGALIALKHRVAPDEVIRIINLENFRGDDFRVVGLSRQEGADYAEWGVECADKKRSLWEIDFPPPMEPGDTEGGGLLRCKGCGKESFLVLSLTEISILESSGSIERLCEKCGELKSWAYSEEIRAPKIHPDCMSSGVPPLGIEAPSPRGAVANEIACGGLETEATPASGPTETALKVALAVPEEPTQCLETEALPLVPPPSQKKIERRLHRRLTLKLPALVRNHKGEVELARTENISKGGLGIGLAMKLTLAEHVTVICPHTGSGQEIEQRAEVRRRVSLYGGERWFYGFRYVTQ